MLRVYYIIYEAVCTFDCRRITNILNAFAGRKNWSISLFMLRSETNKDTALYMYSRQKFKIHHVHACQTHTHTHTHDEYLEIVLLYSRSVCGYAIFQRRILLQILHTHTVDKRTHKRAYIEFQCGAKPQGKRVHQDTQVQVGFYMARLNSFSTTFSAAPFPKRVCANHIDSRAPKTHTRLASLSKDFVERICAHRVHHM